jgi:hypothetical protein
MMGEDDSPSKIIDDIRVTGPDTTRRIGISTLILLAQEIEKIQALDIEALLEDGQPEQKPLTPTQLVSKLKNEGVDDCVIAWRLQEEHEYSTHKIGKTLPANKGANIEQGSISKQGRRLLEKYKEMISKKL